MSIATTLESLAAEAGRVVGDEAVGRRLEQGRARSSTAILALADEGLQMIDER